MSNGGGDHGRNVHEDNLRRRNESRNAVRDYKRGDRKPALPVLPTPGWSRSVIVLAIIAVLALMFAAMG